MENENKSPLIALKREYTLAWSVWGVLILGAELLQIQDNRVWGLLGILFLVIEGIAAYRKKKGDTLSEHIWSFKDGGWARVPLVIGLVGWASFKFYTLTASSGIAAIFLSAGLGIWLMIHMLMKGKHG